jgi:hypothetical protein
VIDDVFPAKPTASAVEVKSFVPLDTSLSDVPLPRAPSGAAGSLGRVLIADDNLDMVRDSRVVLLTDATLTAGLRVTVAA